MDLSAGPHQIRVWYFQATRYELALQLLVTPPGGPERIFTSELQQRGAIGMKSTRVDHGPSARSEQGQGQGSFVA